MRFSLPLLVALVATATACGGSDAKSGGGGPLAEKWIARAKQSYKVGDFDDARDASREAMKAAPSDPQAKVLAAQVAMAHLDFAEALKLTAGIDTEDAHRIRGRAHWYAGHVDEAADELEALLRDPQVRDPWARSIEKLARQGVGRKPFAIEGSLVTAVEMPKVGPALIVPVEINGERILALVATATAEVTVDSSSRKEPAWINLRFGEGFEVKDVPALTQDLSGLTRQFGAPIKALLGANLLRHLNVTFDRRGDQFVVRREAPTPPPDAGRMPAWYVRGGGMVVRASVTGDENRVPLLIDSAGMFPLALEESSWRAAGVSPSSFQAESGAPGMKASTLPRFKLGTYDLPNVPFLAGLHIDEAKASMEVDVGGVVGAGLLSLFRVTLADEGRTVYLEPDPTFGAPPEGSQGPERAPGPGAPPGAAPGAAPAKPGGKGPAAPAPGAVSPGAVAPGAVSPAAPSSAPAKGAAPAGKAAPAPAPAPAGAAKKTPAAGAKP